MPINTRPVWNITRPECKYGIHYGTGPCTQGYPSVKYFTSNSPQGEAYKGMATM